MSSRCCHINVVTSMLPHQCWNFDVAPLTALDVGTSMLKLRCWNIDHASKSMFKHRIGIMYESFRNTKDVVLPLPACNFNKILTPKIC